MLQSAHDKNFLQKILVSTEYNSPEVIIKIDQTLEKLYITLYFISLQKQNYYQRWIRWHIYYVLFNFLLSLTLTPYLTLTSFYDINDFKGANHIPLIPLDFEFHKNQNLDFQILNY